MLNLLRWGVGVAAVMIAGMAAAQTRSASSGQDWPAKPVRVIVPWGPGGGTDIVARALTPGLSENTAQQFIIDNRGGANGIIGTDLTARAPGDGYTIMLNTLSAFVLNTSYYPKLPYNPDRDFAPVTLIGQVPLLMLVHPSFPARTAQDVINVARSRPGRVQYASFATASPSHFAGEILNVMLGIKLVHIPYKGGAAAITALVSGEVPLHFGGVSVALPHVQAGKVRALAVTGAQRTQRLPELPTVAEALKLKDFDVSVTFGVLVPASTPKEIVQRLHDEIGKVVRSPGYKTRLDALGTDLAPLLTPNELGQWLKKETARWAGIIRETGIRAE